MLAAPIALDDYPHSTGTLGKSPLAGCTLHVQANGRGYVVKRGQAYLESCIEVGDSGKRLPLIPKYRCRHTPKERKAVKMGKVTCPRVCFCPRYLYVKPPATRCLVLYSRILAWYLPCGNGTSPARLLHSPELWADGRSIIVHHASSAVFTWKGVHTKTENRLSLLRVEERRTHTTKTHGRTAQGQFEA